MVSKFSIIKSEKYLYLLAIFVRIREKKLQYLFILNGNINYNEVNALRYDTNRVKGPSASVTVFILSLQGARRAACKYTI